MGTDWFFGHHIDTQTLAGRSAMLLLAVLLGGLIGLERQLRGNAAGLRTHSLVCVGSALITLTSVEIARGTHGDPGHIAAQIVSGIGFLGAGAILREGATVRGLTTAASIWIVAGIGIALGASPRMGELAVTATIVVLVTLVGIYRLEMLLRLRPGLSRLDIEVREADGGPARVLDLVYESGITVYGLQSEAGPTSLKQSVMEVRRMMHMRVGLPAHFDRNDFNKRMTQETFIVSFHLE